MKLRVLVVLALGLAIAPAAAAGSEDDPEVPGVEDLEDPALDFQGAWFEPARDGVVFTVKFGGADEAPVDRYYFVAFAYQGERHVAVVAFDRAGDLRTDLRPANFNRQGVRGPEDLGDALEDATFRPGHPAYVSARIPFDALPGLAPGKVIIDLSSATGFYERGARAGWNDVDGRDTQNAYVVQSAILPAALQRSLGWIVAGAFFVLLVVIAVLVVLLRRHAKAAAPPLRPAAPPPSTATRAHEPGEPRFRLDPRK